MIEGAPTRKPIDITKHEHLKKGVKPIMACVGWGTKKAFEKGVPTKMLSAGHNVDFYDKPENLKSQGFENGGEQTYVISPVDNSNKYSKDFFDCTGLVIVGTEKETGKNISFMSHQNPNYFLRKKDSQFIDSLAKRLQTVKDKCEEGTIDAVIFGGRYAEVKNFEKSDLRRNMYIEEYLKSINLLSEKVKSELGFEPLVIAGPKTIPAGDCVFYDNENRRLYLMRGKEDFDSIRSFTPSELEERRKNWKPGEWELPFIF